jgi:hypothetical protein
MTTLSSLLTNFPISSLQSSPEEVIRAVIEEQTGLPPLPVTKKISVYHIRGVSNPKFTGGEDKDEVIFGPEFLYVLDVGFPSACGVQVSWTNSGRGDPSFPNFKGAITRSVVGSSRDQILYPCIPTELMVGVKDGTSDSIVRTELTAYSSSISVLIPNLYLIKVNAFHEQEVARRIETSLPFVKYASLNTVVRIVDFSPGWFVDQVC